MNEFEILSPDREDIIITDHIPTKYKNLLLKGAHQFRADCSFGNMLFNHISGEGYDIWKSDYLIDRPARVIGRTNKQLLELSYIYGDSFSIDWREMGKAKLPFRQIELYHAPYMDNITYFKRSKRIGTVDIHFHKRILEKYVKDFKLLGKFMEKVENNKEAQLFDGLQFSSPRIDFIFKEMISYHFYDELAPRYYDSYVHILLIHLLERISSFHPLSRKFTPSDLDKAQAAKKLLTKEFKQFYSIDQLCEKLLTNPYKLKTAFRHMFGISIGKYKKSILMEHAKILLQTKKYSIDEVSLEVGYSSQQSFSTAFRTYFKVVPTHFKMRR